MTQFLPPGPPLSLEMFEGILERRHKLEAERGHAMWTVELRATGERIGQCGIFLADGPATEFELGYHYRPETWGHGYATEAVAAVVGHGLGALGLGEIIALVIPENVASCRVLEKAGLRLEPEPAIYYDIPGLRKYIANDGWWHPPTT